MAQMFDAFRRAATASTFVPDGLMAICIIALALILIRAMELG